MTRAAVSALRNVVAGHVEIEQDDVRLLAGGEGESLCRIRRLAGHAQSRVVIDQHAQSRAHHCVVINDQNTDGVWGSYGHDHFVSSSDRRYGSKG